jgi:hypothetical protein
MLQNIALFLKLHQVVGSIVKILSVSHGLFYL